MKTVKIKPSSPEQGEFVVINESDFNPNIHELYEGEKLDGEHITVTLSAETAPELQQAIDDAKAECKKVVAENEELKSELAKYQEQSSLVVDSDIHHSVIKERDALLTRVKELDLENNELRKKLRFKELEDQGADVLKAALDHAGVKYKANDGKSVLAQLLLDHESKPKE